MPSAENSTFWKPGRVIAVAVATAATVAGLISNVGIIADFVQPSVDGTWLVTLNIQNSSFKGYDGMTTTLQLNLSQDGHSLNGNGEKIQVNGKDIPSSQHQQLSASGSVSGGHVILQYTLTAGRDGASRQSNGLFDLKVIRNGILSRHAARMEGSFSGTAASTSGSAVAILKPK